MTCMAQSGLLNVDATCGPDCRGASWPISVAEQAELASAVSAEPACLPRLPVAPLWRSPRVEIVLGPHSASCLSPPSRQPAGHTLHGGGGLRGPSAAQFQRVLLRWLAGPCCAGVACIRARAVSASELSFKLALFARNTHFCRLASPRVSRRALSHCPRLPLCRLRDHLTAPRRPAPPRHHADFREDPHGQDHHAGGGVV